MSLRLKGRRTILQLEVLENRIVPAGPPTPGTVEEYPGVQYQNYTGTTVPGQYRPEAPYLVVSTLKQRKSVLDTLTPVSEVSANFKTTLENAYPAWMFAYSANPVAGGVLKVQTYYANAFSTLSVVPQTGDDVAHAGGIIDLNTAYAPAAGEKVRWIQVITQNYFPGAATAARTCSPARTRSPPFTAATITSSMPRYLSSSPSLDAHPIEAAQPLALPEGRAAGKPRSSCT